MNLQLMEYILRADLVVPYAIRAAVSAGLLQELQHRPAKSIEGLADALQLSAVGLEPLLLYLREVGILTLGPDGWRLSTPAARMLTVSRLSAIGLEGLGMRTSQAATEFPHTLRTGESAYEEAFGQSYWDDIREYPELSRALHQELEEVSAAHAHELVTGELDRPFERVVDVGCGEGSLSISICSLVENATVALVDQDPSALSRAGSHAELKVGPTRFSLLKANFISDRLPSGDVYILSQVLHDWPDQMALAILGNVRRAMADEATLIVVERAVESTSHREYNAYMSLRMLLLFGARERLRDGYIDLFDRAGFRVESCSKLSRGFVVYSLVPERSEAPRPRSGRL